MSQPSFLRNDRFELEQLARRVAQLERLQASTQNIGDLGDVVGWGAADGHAHMYDTTTGTFKPMLAPPYVTFNMTGSLSVAGLDRFPNASTGRICTVAGILTTAGSSTTTAVLKKNAATVVTTFTFTSSSQTPTFTALANASFIASDYLWLDVTAAGTGAAGLVVNVWATAA